MKVESPNAIKPVAPNPLEAQLFGLGTLVQLLKRARRAATRRSWPSSWSTRPTRWCLTGRPCCGGARRTAAGKVVAIRARA